MKLLVTVSGLWLALALAPACTSSHAATDAVAPASTSSPATTNSVAPASSQAAAPAAVQPIASGSSQPVAVAAAQPIASATTQPAAIEPIAPSALAEPGTSAARQDPATRAPAASQSDDAGNSLSPEFDALWKQYVSAMRDRDEKRIKAGTANQPANFPHPAPQFFKRFQELADKDNADAQCWVLENLSIAVTDPGEQARIARETFARLVPKHVDMDGVSRAIGGLRKLSSVLGEEATIAMMQKIVDTSTNVEVRAQALFTVAWLKREKGLSKDPKRIAESDEIYRQVVLAFPATKTALEASSYLIQGVERSFLDAERAWTAEVEKLVAAHRPISEWPKQPIHAFDREFQPLAAAGHMDARQFVKFFYPDYVQVEKQGTEIALTWLVARLGERYRNDFEGWGQVRLAMLRLLYTQYPTSNAPWLSASLAGLLGEAPWIPYEAIEPTLRPLFEANQDPKVRSLVLFTMAKSLMRGDDPEINAHVLALLKEIDDKYGDEDVASDAHELRESLTAVLPDATAPDFFLNDSARIPFHLSDYRGRVVMLVFSSFTIPDCIQTIPQRVELMHKLEGRPFSVLGVDIDSPAAENFQRDSARYGQTWRTALVFTVQDPLVHTYLARKFPLTLVIDAAGVIRGRNLAWNESVALVEKLVAETESKGTAKH
jgi:thiol-disulfide isomerase/thioredoxin